MSNKGKRVIPEKRGYVPPQMPPTNPGSGYIPPKMPVTPKPAPNNPGKGGGKPSK